MLELIIKCTRFENIYFEVQHTQQWLIEGNHEKFLNQISQTLVLIWILFPVEA
jgi:hypothetical protein